MSHESYERSVRDQSRQLEQLAKHEAKLGQELKDDQSAGAFGPDQRQRLINTECWKFLVTSGKR